MCKFVLKYYTVKVSNVFLLKNVGKHKNLSMKRRECIPYMSSAEKASTASKKGTCNEEPISLLRLKDIPRTEIVQEINAK